MNNWEFNQRCRAIAVSPVADKVVIKNSLLRHCGNKYAEKYAAKTACILVNNEFGAVQFVHCAQEVTKRFVDLQCEGNVFEDNICFFI